MDAIASYIDHMFRSLPASAEVRRAKQDLLQMSEDRYRELLAEGASENEAVGRVIAQFGNLDEVADELGIRTEVDGAGGDAGAVEMSDEDAERYLALHRRAAWLTAAGVAIIIFGVAALVALAGDAPDESPQAALGLIPLFGGIALAVPLFLVAWIPVGRFRRYEDRAVALSPAATGHYRAQRERETPGFIAGIAGGVALILASLGGMIWMQAVDPVAADGGDSSAGVPVMLAGVGIASALFIVAGIRRGVLDKLASEGDYRPEVRNSKAEQLIGALAGPYWLLATAVFLTWSLGWDAWDRSWMVWPIAGVGFGLLAATIGGIGDYRRETAARPR